MLALLWPNFLHTLHCCFLPRSFLPRPPVLPRRIRVPFPFEAALSGIRQLPKYENMWYRKTLVLPEERLLGRHMNSGAWLEAGCC